jgi:hypothetical protein
MFGFRVAIALQSLLQFLARYRSFSSLARAYHIDQRKKVVKGGVASGG